MQQHGHHLDNAVDKETAQIYKLCAAVGDSAFNNCRAGSASRAAP